MMKNLTTLQEGQSGQVVSLLNKGSIKRRLQDLGLVEGTHVRCIQKSPFGDPVAYGIRGAVIALRMEDAERILICS